jgi:hypothetical protein
MFAFPSWRFDERSPFFHPRTFKQKSGTNEIRAPVSPELPLHAVTHHITKRGEIQYGRSSLSMPVSPFAGSMAKNGPLPLFLSCLCGATRKVRGALEET